jgi:hypothetical protein
MQFGFEKVVLGLVPIIFLFFFYAKRQKIQCSNEIYRSWQNIYSRGSYRSSREDELCKI